MRVPRGTGPAPARLRSGDRPGPIEVARTISSRRAVDGAIQIRYGTDLTVEDYVTQKAWWDASPPDCPLRWLRSGGLLSVRQLQRLLRGRHHDGTGVLRGQRRRG